MLSISNKDYFAPVKLNSAAIKSWKLERVDGNEVSYAERFNYTIFLAGNEEKLTFIFDGNSVKPSPRTLRIYGSEKTSEIVSKLATNTKARVLPR